jgi:hypothetical protein
VPAFDEPHSALEFFIDRSLGRYEVPDALRAAGLTVHTMSSVYGAGAEERVPDQEWIEYGGSRGWVLLTKDERIRYRAIEREAVARSRARVFCLANQQLRSAEQTAWFLDNIGRIARVAAGRNGPFIYKVRASRIEAWWSP